MDSEKDGGREKDGVRGDWVVRVRPSDCDVCDVPHVLSLVLQCSHSVLLRHVFGWIPIGRRSFPRHSSAREGSAPESRAEVVETTLECRERETERARGRSRISETV